MRHIPRDTRAFFLAFLTVFSIFGLAGARPAAGEESFEPYLDLLNELSERRRLNVYFPNEQSIYYGVEVGYVNVGRGNLSFQRRDLVTVGRLPLVLARTYDSSLEGGRDFGSGWRLTAAETIRREAEGFVYVDESASEYRLGPGLGHGVFNVSPNVSNHGPHDIVSFTRDGGGGLRLELSTGLVKTFSPAGEGFRLTRVEDRNGNALELVYENGLLRELRGQHGRRLVLDRDAAGRVISARDDQERRVFYRYDAGGRLDRVLDLGGNAWTYAYDDADRLVRAWDPLGSESFAVAYDGSGRVAEASLPGASYRYRYRGSRTVVTDGQSHTHVFDHHQSGITVGVDNALGVSSRVELDGAHRVRRVLRGGEVETELGYGRDGRLAWVRPARGDRSFFAYDRAGRLAEVRGSGKEPVMSLVYDARGNVLARRDATGEYLYDYSPQGDIVQAALPGGEVFLFEHDADGQILAVTDENGHTTGFEYHPGGRMAAAAFADGSRHRYTYDALGLRSKTDFDYGDGQTARIDYAHNPTGSLIRTVVTNHQGRVSGNELTLDDDQRVVGIDYFGGRLFAFDYDEAGNLVTARADDDGQETIHFTYDALDRLVGVRTVKGEELRWDYGEGEADLRLVYDAKTAPATSLRSAAGTTFASGLEVLLNRTRRSAYGAVAFEPSTMSFALTGRDGVTAPDELALSAWRRMRLFELDAEDYTARFEQPSSILFWPAEYRALNCCIACEAIYGVPCICLVAGPQGCQVCVPIFPKPLPKPGPKTCRIDGPSFVKVGENAVPFQLTISPPGSTAGWTTVTGRQTCLPLTNPDKISARATVTNNVKMTCIYDDLTFKTSNQFSVSGQASTQFVRLTWTSAANSVLAQAFSSASTQSSVKNRVRNVLVSEFGGANISFANSPSGGVSKITTLNFRGNSPGGQGGEATYDRLNFSRTNTGTVYLGSGSLDLANGANPVPSTPINERRTPDRVADAIARLAAHEIAHMLGLVPRSSELTGSFWGEIAICHAVNSLGLAGSSSHHNGGTSSARIMSSTANLTWRQTWNTTQYSFSSANQTYIGRVLN